MVIARDMDRLLMSAVDAGVAPGVVALAADDAGIVYSGAFGGREIGGPADMSLDTVVGMWSMTKAVTSVAAMQLVEQGRIGLDDPLGAQVPELAMVQVLEGFDDAGLPRLRPPRRPITLHHLLTHTAGFSYFIWNTDMLRYHECTGTPTIDKRQLACLGLPLVCDPGDRWEYGISTDWVGQIVERVSGQPLDAYMQEHILDPLGMSDTGFILRPDQRDRFAPRHARQPDGWLRRLPAKEPEAPEILEGGGGLYSTGADYLRFLRMLLGGGELDGVRVLQIGDLNVGELVTAIPEASNTVEFLPGMVKKWGLFAMIATDAVPGGRSAGSLGWGGIANTYFWIDPTRRLTGVLLTQILPFADPGVLDVFAHFERAVYAAHTRQGPRLA
jgi:CubicO group peptidase (beta-lactamase class C family)